MNKTFLVIVAASLLFSCSRESGKTPDAVPSGDYIVTVGDRGIDAGDIKKRLSVIPDYAKKTYESEEGVKNMVDELVKTELLYLQAKKEGLDKDPEYITKVGDYKKFALVGFLFEKEVSSEAKVTEKEARTFYRKNKSNFSPGDKIQASHILVKSKSEAENILKEIRQGKSFESLAEKFSIDKISAEEGGDIGFFSKDEMEAEFEAAAFKLKKGEVSEPVKTKYGYHIIKVTDKRGGKTVEFSKVKDLIIQNLEQEKQQKIFDRYIDGLRKDYPVTINEDRLQKFIHSYTSQTGEE